MAATRGRGRRRIGVALVAVLLAAMLGVPEVPAAAEPGDLSIAAGGNEAGGSLVSLGTIDAVDVDQDGALYVVDRGEGDKAVLRFPPGSTQTTPVDQKFAANEFLDDVAVGPAGTVYAVKQGSCGCLFVWEPGGSLLDKVTLPTGNVQGRVVIIDDALYYTVQKSLEGFEDGVRRIALDPATHLPDPDSDELVIPHPDPAPDTNSFGDIATDPSGWLYVLVGGQVWRYDPATLPVEGTPDAPPPDGYAGVLIAEVEESGRGLAVDAAGTLFVSIISAGETADNDGAVVAYPPGLPPVVTDQDLRDAGFPETSLMLHQGPIAVDRTTGDLFAFTRGSFARSEGNYVVRVEAAGAAVPTVDVAIGDADAVEGDPSSPGTIAFPVTLSEPAPSELTVTFEVTGGTATAGEDVPAGGDSFVVPAGEDEVSLAFDLIGDELVEDDETFTVELVSAAPAATVVGGPATGTIIDDDAVPSVTAAAEPASAPEGDPIVLSATADDDPPGPNALDYSWSPADGLDEPTSATPTFTSRDDGTFSFTVEACDAASQCDDDTVTVTTTNVAPVIEEAPTITADAAGNATIDLTVVFTDPGLDDTHNLEIKWGDDSALETVADVTSPATAQHTYTTADTHTGQACIVDDDDGQDCAEFTWTVTVPTVAVGDAPDVVEGDPGSPPSALTFSLELSEVSDRDVTVELETRELTAIEDVDYLALAETVLIPAGSTRVEVNVGVVADLLAEPDEQLELVLVGADGAIPGVTVATGTILDGDLCDVVGTPGDDIGADAVVGTPADEVICAFGGDDEIDGGGGTDNILAGPGNDTLFFASTSGPVTVDLADGVASGPDLAYTLSGVHNVIGTAFADELRGNGQANRLVGLAGDDQIYGFGGDDTLIGNAGKDRIFGGGGDDTVFGNNGNDTLFGQAGDDSLFGQRGDDLVSGGDGADVVSGGTVEPGGGDDRLFGGAGPDRLFGGSGNDKLFGQNGDDLLSGGDGFDHLHGGRNGQDGDTCLHGERNRTCEHVV